MGCLDLFWVFIKIDFLSAGVAQLVERNLAKVEVASSRLVSRSRYKRRETLSSFPFFVCGPRMTELVDVADLKSAAPKRAYGFDSRFWDQTKIPSRSMFKPELPDN